MTPMAPMAASIPEPSTLALPLLAIVFFTVVIAYLASKRLQSRARGRILSDENRDKIVQEVRKAFSTHGNADGFLQALGGYVELFPIFFGVRCAEDISGNLSSPDGKYVMFTVALVADPKKTEIVTVLLP